MSTNPKVTIGGAEVSVEPYLPHMSHVITEPADLKVMVEQPPDHVYQVDNSRQRFNTGLAISLLSIAVLTLLGVILWQVIRAVRRHAALLLPGTSA